MRPDLTANDVRIRLSMHGGTQKELAEEIGVSQAFLSDVLAGHREPTGKILDYLGLERVTVYRRKRA